MRIIALDTETTGLNKKRNGGSVCAGHRIVEIACVEIIDGNITGRRFHTYINPEQVMDPKAIVIHGLTDGFLSDKPLFKDIVGSFLEFIRGCDVIVIHNASFDISFMDQEFGYLSCELQPVGDFVFIDSLQLARDLFPGQRNRLDDLCRRFGLAGRSGLHNASEDALLLARIFQILMG